MEIYAILYSSFKFEKRLESTFFFKFEERVNFNTFFKGTNYFIK